VLEEEYLGGAGLVSKARLSILTLPATEGRVHQDDVAEIGCIGEEARVGLGAGQGVAERAAKEGISGAKTGSVTVVQRTSSDLRLNPHLHLVALDGAYHEQGAELAWQALGHLKTSEVGEVLERAVRRMEKQLRRRGLLVDESGADPGAEGDADPESNLAASAVSGQAPWLPGLQPLEPHALAYDKPLCVSLDGFTLHAATRAGALDQAGREALLRYVLRPPIAQERLERRPDGLVRITHPASIARYLAAVGEATEVPRRSPSRGPPYWKSRVLRRQALGEGDACHSGGGDEAP
jgi:hypothetical protein